MEREQRCSVNNGRAFHDRGDVGSPAVVSKRNIPAEILALNPLWPENPRMRALALVLVAAAIFYGVYEMYLKKMPTTDAGTVATQAISLTGVRSDLLQIAQAERSNMALNGKCSSLDELISSGGIRMTKTERDGYTYQINCAGTGFQVVAEHPPAPEGSGIRYPKLAIDSTMQLQEVQ